MRINPDLFASQTMIVVTRVTMTDVDTIAATTVVVTTTAVVEVAVETTGEVVDTETSAVTTPGLGTRLLDWFSRLSDKTVAARLDRGGTQDKGRILFLPQKTSACFPRSMEVVGLVRSLVICPVVLFLK
jgi:hypothetical protein